MENNTSKKIKKYNIVWAIVDSVRYYHSEGDDRSRLDFMDEFANDAIEFRHTITSAPSTVMSISAMMTSLPSFYLGRNYSDFRFDNSYFTTLGSILNNHGWKTRALIMHPDIREKLRVFDLVEKKYWPKGFSHRFWWDNSMIQKLLKNTVKLDEKPDDQPVFWFLDFNCREDYQTSDIVKDCFSFMKNNGYTEDNTIFILCSDHGYPDPTRGYTPTMLKEQNLTHDIFMTEDNIRIPMIISYPECEKGKKIDEVISTLDLMPTILSMLKIDVDDDIRERWHGLDLMPLITGSKDPKFLDRQVRVDARFFGQTGRVSALRDKKYKYIFSHDNGDEELISMTDFTIDERNLIDDPDFSNTGVLDKYRNDFQETEDKGKAFQVSYSIYKLKDQLEYLSEIDSPKVMMISISDTSFLYQSGSAIKDSFPHAELTLVSNSSIDEIFDLCLKIEFEDKGITFLDVDPSEIEKQDLIILVYESDNKTEFEKMKILSNSIESSRIMTMDINMTMSISKGQMIRYVKTLLVNRDFYKDEPILILYEIRKIFKQILRKTKDKIFK